MSEDNKKFRLVTRSDFDGLVCAVLLKELDMINDIKFVHPKDMQDGTILITGSDITTNLPYVEGVHLANVGELMLKYGGGGHEAAGTCQVENEDAERVLGELIAQINADG